MCRSDELLARMALELGGNAGAVISRFVKLPVSPSTILRIIKKLEIKGRAVTSGIIGVDDWAIKKRKTYGSIIVDLQTKSVIDLLPDREAGTLAEWLKGHPEISIVSRDRYGPYAAGIKKSLPSAGQVADRFHLLMNLGEAVKRVLQSKSRQLKAVFKLYSNPEQDVVSTLAEDRENVNAIRDKDKLVGNISIDRQHKFEEVKALHYKGYSLKAISKTLSVHRQTIKKYIAQDSYPLRENNLFSQFNNYVDYLLQKEKQHLSYRELHRSIQALGFRGGYSQFCANMNQLLNIHPVNSNNSYKSLSGTVRPVKSWSSTRLSMMLYMDQQAFNNPDDIAFLRLLFEQCPEIKQMEELVKKFKQLFVTKKDGLLENWIREAVKPGSTLKHFAENLRKDFQAVNNAIITPYSNGQVEGQVNRLKTIKRKMYGRAGFDLLRKMVLAKSG